MPLVRDPEKVRTVWLENGMGMLVGGWRWRAPETPQEVAEEVAAASRYVAARYGARARAGGYGLACTARWVWTGTGGFGNGFQPRPEVPE